MRRLIQTHLDFFLIIGLVLLNILFFQLRAQYGDLTFGDASYYLNRGYTFWRFVYDADWMYNVYYPIWIGVFLQLGIIPVYAGFIVNALSLFILLYLTNYLAQYYYNTSIARLSLFFIALHPDVNFMMSHMEPPLLFTLTLVLILWATHYVIQTSSFHSMIILCFMILGAFLTRLEGAMFAIFVPLAGLHIALIQKRWQRAFILVVFGTIIVSAGILSYLSAYASLTPDTPAVSFTMRHLLVVYPVDWEVLAQRFTDLWLAITDSWSIWVFTGLIVIIALGSKKFIVNNLAIISFIIYFAICQYILLIWPYPSKVWTLIPLTSVLIAWSIWRVAQENIVRRFIAGIAFVLITIMPFVSSVSEQFTTPTLSFTQDDNYIATIEATNWLNNQTEYEGDVFTFCKTFSATSNFRNVQLIQRVVSLDPVSNDSAEEIIPLVAESNGLFLTCPGVVRYLDWQDYFSDQSQLPYEWNLVQKFDSYEFYSIRSMED